MPNLLRKWWIWAGLLLIAAPLYFLWPRPIQVRLKDGTRFTIAAITVGTEHRKPEPVSWPTIKTQIARRQWGWPIRTSTTPAPCMIFWLDDPKLLDNHYLVVVDRYGWRSHMTSGWSDGRTYQVQFQLVETDGTARIEVHDKGGLLGATQVSLVSAVPARAPEPLPTIPPIPVTFGKPTPLPMRRVNGPLDVTLRAFDLRENVQPECTSEGRFQLDALWDGEPIVPAIGLVAITDRFGRRELLSAQANQPFMIRLPPREAIWDLHLQICRRPETPLDADEMIQVVPTVAKGQPFFQQEGSHRGHAWRLTFIPSGSASIPARFESWAFGLQEEVPTIVVECDPTCSMQVRIDALDRQGESIPANPVDRLNGPSNAFAFRSPDFDATKGHTIRIGFDERRLMHFTLRPEVTRVPPADFDTDRARIEEATTNPH